MARVTVANRPGADGLPVALESSPAESMLNALLKANVRIRHDCGGKALCGTCALRVLEGGASLSPVLPREAERLESGGRAEGFRLACQAHAMRDIEMEIVLD
jgi:CDP-4-dehydro-6-deoxyglucose reductase, E3